MIFNFDESTLLGSLSLLIIILIFLRYQKKTLSYLFCFALFWIYLSMVVEKTLLPIPLYQPPFEISFWDRVNLNPLYFGPFAELEDVWPGLVLNVILTIPFGFGINFIVRCSAKSIFWIALVVGLTIEGLQLLISLGIGFPYRVIDIHDFFSNAVGVLVGYLFFTIFAFFYVRLARRSQFKLNGLLGYVLEVATGRAKK